MSESVSACELLRLSANAMPTDEKRRSTVYENFTVKAILVRAADKYDASKWGRVVSSQQAWIAALPLDLVCPSRAAAGASLPGTPARAD